MSSCVEWHHCRTTRSCEGCIGWSPLAGGTLANRQRPALPNATGRCQAKSWIRRRQVRGRQAARTSRSQGPTWACPLHAGFVAANRPSCRRPLRSAIPPESGDPPIAPRARAGDLCFRAARPKKAFQDRAKSVPSLPESDALTSVFVIRACPTRAGLARIVARVRDRCHRMALLRASTHVHILMDRRQLAAGQVLEVREGWHGLVLVAHWQHHQHHPQHP